jgi:Fic family protein
MNAPVYTISTRVIDLVAKIAERVGELKGSGEYSRNLRLQKINRLRSIQSSLAIENNTLTLGQVTDIIEGKRVFGLPHEIQEVKNAYQAYEHLLEYNPYKIKDFLKAHQFMTLQLVKEAGQFRKRQEIRNLLSNLCSMPFCRRWKNCRSQNYRYIYRYKYR